jgi:hypothetical protein
MEIIINEFDLNQFGESIAETQPPYPCLGIFSTKEQQNLLKILSKTACQ